MFPEWETQRLLIYNKENLEQCSQSTPIKDGRYDFNGTMTSLSQKLSSSVIESASKNENVSDEQTSTRRRNHLKAMKENLTLLKMVEIMRQIKQKKILR